MYPQCDTLSITISVLQSHVTGSVDKIVCVCVTHEVISWLLLSVGSTEIFVRYLCYLHLLNCFLSQYWRGITYHVSCDSNELQIHIISFGSRHTCINFKPIQKLESKWWGGVVQYRPHNIFNSLKYMFRVITYPMTQTTFKTVYDEAFGFKVLLGPCRFGAWPHILATDTIYSASGNREE